MAIETSHPNHGVRKSQHADSHKGAKDAQAAGTGTGGVDFMALLAEMAGGEAVGVGADETGENACGLGLVTAALLPVGDTPTPPPWADLGLQSVPTVPSQADAPADLASTGLVDVQSAADSRASAVVGVVPNSLLQTSNTTTGGTATPVVTTPVQAILDGLEGLGGAQPQPLQSPVPLGGKAPATGGAGASIDPAAAQLEEEPPNTLAPKTGKAAKSLKASVIDDSASLAQEASGGWGNGKTVAAEQRLQSLIFRQMEMQPTSTPLVASLSQELNGLVRESARGRLADKQPGPESVGPTNLYTPTESGLGVAEPAPAWEGVVAEKVAYWVTHDVQKAELKLDGLGEQPVEVSIRMNGSEAHVAFRTDELQTRSALEQAGSELKEMLQREGLTLAGVSVGTTGGGEGQRNSERKSRAPARQGSIEMVVSPQPNPTRAVGTGVGRSLDLFV